MLESLLKQLCQNLQLAPPPQKDAHNQFTLSLNPVTSLDFQELEIGFSCKSIVAKIPDEPLEDLLILLMKANFLGQGTKGAVLAIDEKIQHFVFILHVPEETPYIVFKDKIEDFVNYLNYWKERIHKEIKKQ